MSCNLCDGSPYSAIWHDCCGCDKGIDPEEFCEECGEHESECECGKMKVIEGDLIKLAQEGEFDVIVHGCNCFCNMGAGIADTIAEVFPDAMLADQMTTLGDPTKLGTYSQATVGDITIVNAYTQYKYTRNEVDVDYDALRECFASIAEEFSGQRIGYPLIGAGLAGGDWDIISEIIEEELEGEDHTLVKFNGKYTNVKYKG